MKVIRDDVCDTRYFGSRFHSTVQLVRLLGGLGWMEKRAEQSLDGRYAFGHAEKSRLRGSGCLRYLVSSRGWESWNDPVGGANK
jgi:hypothetical protein